MTQVSPAQGSYIKVTQPGMVRVNDWIRIDDAFSLDEQCRPQKKVITRVLEVKDPGTPAEEVCYYNQYNCWAKTCNPYWNLEVFAPTEV